MGNHPLFVKLGSMTYGTLCSSIQIITLFKHISEGIRLSNYSIPQTTKII